MRHPPSDGIGALRNVHQLISKAFNRAVVIGLIDVIPLKRAPDVKRPFEGAARGSL